MKQEETQKFLERRKIERMKFLPMILGSYEMDAIFLALYSYIGVVNIKSAIFMSIMGFVTTGIFYIFFKTGFSEKFQDHHMVSHQMVFNSIVALFVTWMIPQIGLMTIMLFFIVFSMGALRMKFKRTVMWAVLIAILTSIVFIYKGSELKMPLNNNVEKIITGFWFASFLIRVCSVGMYGAALRKKLLSKNIELNNAFEKVEYLANFDELTEVYNRRKLMSLLNEKINCNNNNYFITLIDIDYFKKINDNFGHLLGDDALKTFAKIINLSKRNNDFFGRYGGEEFLLVINAEDKQNVINLLNRIRKNIEEYDWAKIHPELKITASFGAAKIKCCSQKIDVTLSQADEALYQAKNNGRNQVVIYESKK